MTLARSTQQSSVDSAMSIGDMRPAREPTFIHVWCTGARDAGWAVTLLAQIVSLAYRSRSALLLKAYALPAQPFPSTPGPSQKVRKL